MIGADKTTTSAPECLLDIFLARTPIRKRTIHLFSNFWSYTYIEIKCGIMLSFNRRVIRMMIVFSMWTVNLGRLSHLITIRKKKEESNQKDNSIPNYHFHYVTERSFEGCHHINRRVCGTEFKIVKVNSWGWGIQGPNDHHQVHILGLRETLG